MDPKTIHGQIECLARLTGAPETFVEQVRALFRNKGIPLGAEVAPYLSALEEAFRREENIRRTTGRARQRVAELQAHFSRLGRAHRRHAQLSGPLDRNRPAGRRSPAKPPATTPVALDTRGRKVIVTRPQRETTVMVPGPDGPQ